MLKSLFFCFEKKGKNLDCRKKNDLLAIKITGFLYDNYDDDPLKAYDHESTILFCH